MVKNNTLTKKHQNNLEKLKKLEAEFEKERKKQLWMAGIGIGAMIVFMLLLLVVFIVIAAALGSYSSADDLTEEETGLERNLNESSSLAVQVGTCPSMKPFIDELSLDELEHIPFQSTGEALYHLSQGNVDAVIVGRLAFSHELSNNHNEYILRDGHTFVAQSRMEIPFPLPDELIIHTALHESIVEEIIPNHEVTYHESDTSAFQSLNQGEVLLINWNDFQPHYELAVVVFPDGTKPYHFRLPTIYYADIDESILERLANIAEYCCVVTI